MAEQTTLTVKGMTCGHCVKAVEDSVGKLEGVNTVSVNLNEGTVDIDFDSSKINSEKFTDTIEAQGFDVE